MTPLAQATTPPFGLGRASSLMTLVSARKVINKCVWPLVALGNYKLDPLFGEDTAQFLEFVREGLVQAGQGVNEPRENADQVESDVGTRRRGSTPSQVADPIVPGSARRWRWQSSDGNPA